MKKIIIILSTILFILIVGISVSYTDSIKERSNLGPLRPEVRKWIDMLANYPFITIIHTTKDAEQAKQFNKSLRIPDVPKPFNAGRYKIIFSNGYKQKKAIICQTEEIVGHLSTVIPGQTKVGGWVQLLDNPSEDSGSGPNLNQNELDYFIHAIYKKFSQPLDDGETKLLNQVKDYGLSIMFSDKKGIDEYHNKLIQQLKMH